MNLLGNNHRSGGDGVRDQNTAAIFTPSHDNTHLVLFSVSRIPTTSWYFIPIALGIESGRNMRWF